MSNNMVKFQTQRESFRVYEEKFCSGMNSCRIRETTDVKDFIGITWRKLSQTVILNF